MTHDDHVERPLDRRLLLRGGAVLAGAAGVTVVGAALGPAAAQAADGGSLLIGKDNSGTASTKLTGAAGATPSLSLTNTNGPALRLNTLPGTYAGELGVGDLAGSEFGPLVGVDLGDGPQTGYLLTDNDYALIPVASPLGVPVRRLDTRDPKKRGGIVQKSSSGAVDSSGRLTAGSWIDVRIDAADGEFELTGVFLNLCVIGPAATGWGVVYPPGTRPEASTINFRAGVSLSNAAFVAVGQYQTSYVVRVYSSQTTHIVLDYSGSVSTAASAPAGLAAKSDSQRRTARQGKRAVALRAKLSRSAG